MTKIKEKFIDNLKFILARDVANKINVPVGTVYRFIDEYNASNPATRIFRLGNYVEESSLENAFLQTHEMGLQKKTDTTEDGYEKVGSPKGNSFGIRKEPHASLQTYQTVSFIRIYGYSSWDRVNVFFNKKTKAIRCVPDPKGEYIATKDNGAIRITISHLVKSNKLVYPMNSKINLKMEQEKDYIEVYLP